MRREFLGWRVCEYHWQDCYSTTNFCAYNGILEYNIYTKNDYLATNQKVEGPLLQLYPNHRKNEKTAIDLSCIYIGMLLIMSRPAMEQSSSISLLWDTRVSWNASIRSTQSLLYAFSIEVLIGIDNQFDTEGCQALANCITKGGLKSLKELYLNSMEKLLRSMI